MELLELEIFACQLMMSHVDGAIRIRNLCLLTDDASLLQLAEVPRASHATQ